MPSSDLIPLLTKEQSQLLDIFVQHAADPRLRTGDGYKGFEVPNMELVKLSEQIIQRIVQPDLDYNPGISVSSLAIMIKKATLEIIASLPYRPNRALWQRLMAQAVCDWVRTHIRYDRELELAIDRNPIPELLARKAPEYILKQTIPSGVCTGFSLLTRNLAREIGVSCFYVNGVTRSAIKKQSPKPHHVWNIFVLGDGMQVPADASRSPIGIHEARENIKKCRSILSMPIFVEEFAIVSMVCHDYNSMNSVAQGDRQNQFHLSDLTYEDWRNIDLRTFNKKLPVGNIFGA